MQTARRIAPSIVFVEVTVDLKFMQSRSDEYKLYTAIHIFRS